MTSSFLLYITYRWDYKTEYSCSNSSICLNEGICTKLIDRTHDISNQLAIVVT